MAARLREGCYEKQNHNIFSCLLKGLSNDDVGEGKGRTVFQERYNRELVSKKRRFRLRRVGGGYRSKTHSHLGIVPAGVSETNPFHNQINLHGNSVKCRKHESPPFVFVERERNTSNWSLETRICMEGGKKRRGWGRGGGGWHGRMGRGRRERGRRTGR